MGRGGVGGGATGGGALCPGGRSEFHPWVKLRIVGPRDAVAGGGGRALRRWPVVAAAPRYSAPGGQELIGS